MGNFGEFSKVAKFKPNTYVPIMLIMLNIQIATFKFQWEPFNAHKSYLLYGIQSTDHTHTYVHVHVASIIHKISQATEH